MTKPRSIVPGSSYMRTRRTTQRQFLLKPDKTTQENFLYCFALTAQRRKVAVHWLMVMSNHYHDGITDPDGEVAEFSRDFHSLLARCMNRARGRSENFWSTEATGLLQLGSGEDVFDKLIYALTNPCAAHLVDKVSHWPGLSAYESILTGKPLRVKKPKKFFSSKNKELPDEVELRFVRPEQFAHLSEEEWRNKVKEAVEKREHELREKRLKEGQKLLGRKAAKRQSAFSRPRSQHKGGGLNPRIAAKNKWLRIEAIRRRQVFCARYKKALEVYRSGVRSVLFPYGTYKLMREGYVCVEGPPLTA